MIVKTKFITPFYEQQLFVSHTRPVEDILLNLSMQHNRMYTKIFVFTRYSHVLAQRKRKKQHNSDNKSKRLRAVCPIRPDLRVGWGKGKEPESSEKALVSGDRIFCSMSDCRGLPLSFY